MRNEKRGVEMNIGHNGNGSDLHDDDGITLKSNTIYCFLAKDFFLLLLLIHSSFFIVSFKGVFFICFLKLFRITIDQQTCSNFASTRRRITEDPRCVRTVHLRVVVKKATTEIALRFGF